MSVSDGGVVAITGFVWQSLEAILDFLGDPTVDQLEIEPCSSNDDCQKVDIRVMTQDRKVWVYQIKHSKNEISTEAAKRWASELRQTYDSADVYELRVLGLIPVPLQKLRDHEGVRIRALGVFCEEDIHDRWEAVYYRAADYCGIRDKETLEHACRALVGMTIVNVVDRKVWMRAELIRLLARLSSGSASRGDAPNRSYQIRSRRVIRFLQDGAWIEDIKIAVTGAHPPSLSLVWSDAEKIWTFGVDDGTPGNPLFKEIRDGDGVWKLEIYPRWQGDSERQALYARTRRFPGVHKIDGQTWLFSDPVNPTDSILLDMDIIVIFPYDFNVLTSNAEQIDGRCLSWKFNVGNAQQRLSASVRFCSPRQSVALPEWLSPILKEHHSRFPGDDELG